VTTYAYDPAGQLLSVTGDAGLDGVYAYDLHGNRSTFTDYTAGVGQTKDTYVYNKADQLDKINRQSWTGSAWGGSALFEDYTNDNAGRRTAMDDSDVDTIADVSYAYDERGQIATLVDGDGTWTFKHDGEGVVNEFSLGSAATPLVWDRSRLGGELLTFGPTSDFVTQVDGLGRYRSTGVQPLGQDHEGSAIKSTGYESYPQAYDPFGDPTSTTSIATSHIGYRDELQYADLVHLRNRDYDPSVGAFTTMDPLATGPNSPELGTSIPLAGGTPVETNAYHYVGNDPLNFVDPLGLCRTTDVYFDTFTNVDPDEATVVEGPEGGFGYSQCEDAGSVTCTPQPYRRELGDRAGAVRCGPRDGVPLLPNCFTWMDDCDSMATDLPGGPFNCSFMDQGCDTEHLVISVNICVLICFVYGTQDGERFWGLGGTGLSGPTVNVGAANLHICDRENTSVGASASYGGGVYAQEGWDDRAVTEDWEVGSSYGWGFAGMGGGGAVAEMHTWNTC
jgi:RHS repeat-associated protein